MQLHPLDRTHVARTLQWMNDPELSRLLNRTRRVTEAEHERWFADIVSRADCRYRAIETTPDGHHVGNVWLWNIDRRHHRAEVRIVIGDSLAMNRGFGAEALSLVADEAFGPLRLHRLYAYVLDINPRACRAFEKAGFEREGLLRLDRWSVDRYVDVHLLGRVRQDAS